MMNVNLHPAIVPGGDCERLAAECEERETQLLANVALLTSCMPAGAVGLVIARYEVDDCNCMADHFGVKTTRNAAIGWHFSSRDSFSVMRRCAEAFPETAHLGMDAAPSVEHREHYAGGSGNYLKAGHRWGTGWRVEIMRNWRNRVDGVWEIHIPATNKPDSGQAPAAGCAEVRLNSLHRGVEIHFPEKPCAEVLQRLRDATGWRYSRFSRCWYARHTPERESWARQLVASITP